MLFLISLTAAIILIILILIWALDKLTMSPKDYYVLITGCDTGFGNMLAKSLDKRGCFVFATCLTSAGADSLRESSSERLRTIVMDVTDSDSIKAAFDNVEEVLSANSATLWGLVNNAGLNGYMGFYDWWTRDDYRRLMEVNLFGPIEVTNVFLPLMRSKGKGRIVNVSSGIALAPFSAAGYEMTKCALEVFSDCLSHQLHYSSISVHIIEPTYFLTNMNDGARKIDVIQRAWDRLPQRHKEYYGKHCLEKFIADTKQEEQVANPNLHMVTDAIEHALFGWFPWRRYPVGALARFIARPISCLPTFLVDRLRQAVFPLPKPRGIQ